MSSSIPPVPNLVAFEAVARRRSFLQAAAELHLSASTVSHQVARLESFLRMRLLERSAHGVRLSAAGERYLSRVSGALSALTVASDDMRRGIDNSLYVHAAPSFATLWLAPRLHKFAEAYPDISLNLSASHVHSDFTLGQADLDIRYGRPNWPNLVVEPLFDDTILPLASPAFIRKHQIKRLDQLADLPLIQSNVSIVQWSDWFDAVANRPSPGRFHMRFDRAQMALEVAAQGLGVALESLAVAERYLAQGTLKPVFGLDSGVEVKTHHAVFPARHSSRLPVESFLTWLHREASQRPQLRKGGALSAASRSKLSHRNS